LIKAFSQRLMPPYSGQMQMVESDRARAVTLDNQSWEIQFLHMRNDLPGADNNSQRVKRSYMRVATINDSDLRQMNLLSDENKADGKEVDERIVELIEFLEQSTLPFPAQDKFEYWLLDTKDQSPLALIYSCVEEDQKKIFPERAEWTALPAAVMPIERSEEEKEREYAPINYQLERLVADRAGWNAKAKWFVRGDDDDESFPPLLIRQDWEDEQSAELCKRYLHRQSPRLLMLHGLAQDVRKKLEINASSQALEVERFYKLYPEIIDEKLLKTILVEAKLRSVTEGEPAINKRRDGIHYL